MFEHSESFPCGEGVHTITVRTDNKVYAKRVEAFCRAMMDESEGGKKRTNAEKYMSAKERAQAFNDHCEKHERCAGCPLCHCPHCEFAWLDLEAEEQAD